MYSALMAYGFSSIKNQLEEAAKSVIGEWTKLAEDVDGFDLKLGDKFGEKVDQRADSFFERKLFRSSETAGYHLAKSFLKLLSETLSFEGAFKIKLVFFKYG